MEKISAMTVGDVARHFKCKTWQVRRLFTRGLLPPAQRLGPYRVVATGDLPRIEAALIRAGYLPPKG